MGQYYLKNELDCQEGFYIISNWENSSNDIEIAKSFHSGYDLFLKTCLLKIIEELNELKNENIELKQELKNALEFKLNILKSKG
jgi:hypothetical protein